VNDRVLLSGKDARRTKSVTHVRSISTSEIRAELERILSSGIFATAGRMKRFLRFVVKETLEGRGDKLNELQLALKSMIGTRNSILEWTRLSEWMPGDCVPS